MNAIDRKVIFMVIVVAIVIIVPIILITLIKRIVKKFKKSSCYTTARPNEGPYISVEYMRDGGLFEDGKCGWLDIECEDGEEKTVELNFNKKSPLPIFVPLKIAKYRITYRTKSKAAMLAEGALTAFNASNGAMGAFANAVYDAGGMNGQLSSVVVDVNAEFVMKLRCSTDGIQKSCEVIS